MTDRPPPDATNSIVVCMRVADMPIPAFGGDLLETCSKCHLPVRLRPHMPPWPRVCTRCVGLSFP